MTHCIFTQRALCAAWCASMLAACRPEPARAPAPIEPDRIVMIEGSIQLQTGDELAYRAIVAPKPAAPGEYLGTIDIPQQAMSAASLEGVMYQPGEHIEFELAVPGTPHWKGYVQTDGSLACVFTQGDIKLRCTMRDVSPHPALGSD